MENKSLFSILSELEALQIEIEENGGELSDETLLSLELTETALKVKSENYVRYIKKLEHEAEFMKEYRDKAIAEMKKREKLIETLKSKLLNAVFLYGDIQTDLFKIGTRKSESVTITDESVIPNEYKVFEPKINKTAIKEAIKSGATVAGAEITENKNLSIR